MLEVETQMGRERNEKWGPRVIDLDVLVYGDVTLADDDLTLPHPHITKRAFVLAPLAMSRRKLRLMAKPLPNGSPDRRGRHRTIE
jgi:2-amino-4-hydroxy-6-hydroxymethyldihydropteridine diphosphokinase